MVTKLRARSYDIFLLFQAYASRGYVAVAIDSRYHGERAKIKTSYRDVCSLLFKLLPFNRLSCLLYVTQNSKICMLLDWLIGYHQLVKL